MKRVSVAVVAILMAAGTLSACGGGNPYCDTVKGGEKTLNSFGQTRTDKAYQGYTDLLSKIAKVAPAGVKSDWTTLSAKTDGVLTAQTAVGFKLEDMTDTKKVADTLKAADLKTLNDAYTAFNGTTKERAAIVK